MALFEKFRKLTRERMYEVLHWDDKKRLFRRRYVNGTKGKYYGLDEFVIIDGNKYHVTRLAMFHHTGTLPPRRLWVGNPVYGLMRENLVETKKELGDLRDRFAEGYLEDCVPFEKEEEWVEPSEDDKKRFYYSSHSLLEDIVDLKKHRGRFQRNADKEFLEIGLVNVTILCALLKKKHPDMAEKFPPEQFRKLLENALKDKNSGMFRVVVDGKRQYVRPLKA